MLFSVFYVGDSCQGWGHGEFESLFPLQIQKPQLKNWGFFIFLNCFITYFKIINELNIN